VPRQILGTLNLSILNSIRTSIIFIFLHKLYFAAIPEHSESFALKSYVNVVAHALDLQRVSINNETEFLYYSSTIKLFLSLMLIKWSY
jgi:hypothetical protein